MVWLRSITEKGRLYKILIGSLDIDEKWGKFASILIDNILERFFLFRYGSWYRVRICVRLLMHCGKFVFKVGQVDCQRAMGDKLLAFLIGGLRRQSHSWRRWLLSSFLYHHLCPTIAPTINSTRLLLTSRCWLISTLLYLTRTIFANMISVRGEWSIEWVVETEVKVRLDAIFITLLFRSKGWFGQGWRRLRWLWLLKLDISQRDYLLFSTLILWILDVLVWLLERDFFFGCRHA